MARPTKGLQLVDELPGDEQAKERLKWILLTLLGLCSVQEALVALGIGRTYFAMLRRGVLDAAMEHLRPKPCGRRRKTVTVTAEQLDGMRRRIAALERENRLLQAQIDVAHVQALAGGSRSKRHSAVVAS